jgi:DME family drug/metabolite transporter
MIIAEDKSLILSIVFSILCSIGWGAQAVFIKRAAGKVGPYTMIALISGFNFLVLFPLVMNSGGIKIYKEFSGSAYFYFALAGLSNLFLGRRLYYSSLRWVGVTKATAISSIYPLLTIVFALGMLGEELTGRQYLGVVLTLAGVYLLVIKGKK